MGISVVQMDRGFMTKAKYNIVVFDITVLCFNRHNKTFLLLQTPNTR